jgi:hypothetical protein
MAKPVYLHYSVADEAFFDPGTNTLRGGFALLRNDDHVLRIQAVLNRGATVSQSTYQASTRTVDLSVYTGTPVFGLKTETNFAADGDYTQAWSGYATDAAWHSLSNGRLSLTVAPTVTPATYVAEFQLQTSGSSAWTLHGGGAAAGKLRCILLRDLAIGNEATAVSGVTNTSGTATVTAGQTSKVVSYTGMTAAGVVIVSLLNVSEMTTLSVTPATNQFTITLGASYDTNVTVGYLVASL